MSFLITRQENWGESGNTIVKLVSDLITVFIVNGKQNNRLSLKRSWTSLAVTIQDLFVHFKMTYNIGKHYWRSDI